VLSLLYIVRRMIVVAEKSGKVTLCEYYLVGRIENFNREYRDPISWVFAFLNFLLDIILRRIRYIVRHMNTSLLR